MRKQASVYILSVVIVLKPQPHVYSSISLSSRPLQPGLSFQSHVLLYLLPGMLKQTIMAGMALQVCWAWNWVYVNIFYILYITYHNILSKEA